MKKLNKLAAIACTLAIGTGVCAGMTACNSEHYDFYVGNTAGTTGAFAPIGLPFNYGIEAALYEYNQNGGFTGTYNGQELTNGKVGFKHYDDGGKATDTVTYTQRLIEEDEVFAIVGNFGSYAVTANLDIIKDAQVPMVYAAAGNEEMSNTAATNNDRYIFPVQPINSTEGRTLIQRAFASAANGGLGGTKVGVISNNNEASIAILNGIKAEAVNLTAEQQQNINYQNVSDVNTGYGSAATALKNAGCDVVILALTTDYIKSVNALMDAGYNMTNVKIITSYNNASTTLFDKDGAFDTTYLSIIYAIYAQAWMDITDYTYVYNTEGGLWDSYKALIPGYYDNGVTGFGREYWDMAEALYNYGIENEKAVPANYTAFSLTYDAYAMAGYIAGNLFCQGLEAVEDSGNELTRANYVNAMESKTFHLISAGDISFANGKRLGVDSFTLNAFAPLTIKDEDDNITGYGATFSYVAQPFSTLEELRNKNN